LTGKIIKATKRRIDKLTLVPSDGGRFEISIDGDLIYSKKKTGKFPDEDKLVKQIQKKLK
jgi:selenoprotein W-related protein